MILKRILVGLLLVFGLILCISPVLYFQANKVYAQEKGQNSTNNYETDIEVKSLPGSPVTNQLKERASSSWPWYLTRASGITAAILLVILLLSGMGFITGHSYKFLEPINAWVTHRAIGIALGIAVLIHISSLLFDHFIPFNLLQILVPFASKYKTVNVGGLQLGSLYVALGILAFYLLIAIIVTSLLLVDKKSKLWKLIHIMSYLVILFVFFHAIKIGTDMSHGILKYIWIIAGISILFVFLVRLKRVKTT